MRFEIDDRTHTAHAHASGKDWIVSIHRLTTNAVGVAPTLDEIRIKGPKSEKEALEKAVRQFCTSHS